MTITIRSTELDVVVDPGRGADILSLVDRSSGLDLLFRTPWRERADAVRQGQATSTVDSTARWLEGYRGGWQTLCPVAGDAAVVHGAPVTFHGEASLVPWTVDERSGDTVRLSVELFSVPLRIERVVTVIGAHVTVTDELVNLSTVDLDIAYVQHPAFGGPFLDGNCVMDTGAQTFTIDPGRDSPFPPGREFTWPDAQTSDRAHVDLRVVPARGENRELFGWLGDFAGHWASITNHDLGLTVRVEWDGEHLPYAWLWQELEATGAFPWYRRARAVAIEPASVRTDGANRRSALVVPASSRLRIALSVSLTHQPPGGPHA